eukprot:3711103-Karenia_brevis.AAC.1
MVLDSPTYNLPQGLRLFLKSSLQMVRAFSEVEGKRSFFFLVLRGVVQGCPLAGWLFALFLDPALRMFKTIIVQPTSAHMFATADDLAGLIPNLTDIELIYALFLTIEKASIDDKTVGIFRRYLSARVPQWAFIPIEDAARYLGFMIGPKAASCLWHTPIAHWKETTQLVTDANLTPNMSVAAYNSRAFPRLAYHLQLLDVPKDLLAAERQ